jgi:two-component system nitrate/nitrite response regulator NarL
MGLEKLDKGRSRMAGIAADRRRVCSKPYFFDGMAVYILVVDDHALLRGGMRFLLRSLDAGLEMDEAGDCAQALQRVASQRYDLVLLDLKMPGLDGLDALDALRDAAPEMPLVVISGEDDPRVVRAAIERGAMGFIPKTSTPEVLVQALRLVLAHGVYLPPAVLDSVRTVPPAQTDSGEMLIPGLTPRQMDVLRCVIRGLPNKIIARELDVSEGTVKAHLTLVLRALGAHSRTEAVYAAAKLGLRIA